jgi:aryl-alcohol dehydrogenase-like predicted oxidoreductase
MLGNTGIEVSRLSLGTVKIGRNQGVKYPHGFEIPSDEAVIALLRAAQKNGVNTLDTAPAYGESERRLGELLPHVGGRAAWVIVGKVGENFENGQSSFDFSAKAIEESVNRSLSRLNTDYLDVVLLHSDGGEIEKTAHLEAFPTLQKLKEEGKIRAYGMSTKTLAGGRLTLAHADVVMLTYHEGYEDEYPLIVEAAEQNKGVLVKKSLKSGHLPDPAGALAFVLKEEGVSSVVMGTLNIAHLEANCQVACFEKKA